MTAPLSSVVAWRLNANRAEFQLDTWSGSIDLTHPESGVAVHESATIAADSARVLGIEISQPGAVLGSPSDAYVREADLVARYAESTAFPFGIQAYWSLMTREIAGNRALQIDLLISIQTQRLDVRARIGSSSQVASRAAWQCAATNSNAALRQTESSKAESLATGISRLVGDRQVPWVLCALTPSREPLSAVSGPAGSYVEATPSTDFLSAELGLTDGSLTIRRHLLDEIMEKGVIRLLSCRGIFVRGPVGPEVAQTLYQELVHEKPRLTT